MEEWASVQEWLLLVSLARRKVDPRPPVGVSSTLETFRHREPLLPAMGYSEKQIRELEAT